MQGLHLQYSTAQCSTASFEVKIYIETPTEETYEEQDHGHDQGSQTNLNQEQESEVSKLHAFQLPCLAKL